MSRRDPTVCISQMLDHAREAREMVRGCSRADLDTNRMLNLALVRLMEVVGEAATRIPQEFQSRYPQIPWRRITGLRNRLAHGYDTVDFDILWDIIQDEFPSLIGHLEAVVNERS